MKREQLNESIIGRRCVVYSDKKYTGVIKEVTGDKVRIKFDSVGNTFWHYKAVRLLKKKKAPVFWVNEKALNGEDNYNLNNIKQYTGQVRVKLIRVKDGES